MKIRYNAPVVLTISLAAATILLIDGLTRHALIKTLFVSYPSLSVRDLLSWPRLFTHILGHSSWGHLIGNLSFLLLIGPMLEEKYGSRKILFMVLATALSTALLNILFIHAGLLGASGVVFMFILLSSFTNIRQREIPLTFVLIVILYLSRELVEAFKQDQISQLAHFGGGACGALFGFLFGRK